MIETKEEFIDYNYPLNILKQYLVHHFNFTMKDCDFYTDRELNTAMALGTRLATFWDYSSDNALTVMICYQYRGSDSPGSSRKS